MKPEKAGSEMNSETCGVGCQLAKMIPDWATQFKDGCGCKDMASKMDKWGPKGCHIRKNQIVAHLLEQSDHLVPMLRLVPETAKRAIADRLVRKAIVRAKDSV